MENKLPHVAVKLIMDTIKVLIKDEFIATYAEEELSLRIKLINGQNFRVFVEEV